MSQDILAPDKKDIENYKQTDVFEWANNLVEFKDELKIDLFFLSKTYVPYKMATAKGLKDKLEPLFIDGMLDYVLEGVDAGLIVRGFEDAESEEGVLQRTQLFKVERAKEALNWIKHQEHELEVFNEKEHDFRRIKGIIARVTHKDMKQPFFVAKALPSASTMSPRVSWMVREGAFVPFDAEAALKVPTDNQLLIIDQDIYVFSQAKLKQLFGYDAKEASIAEKKVEEILSLFNLSFAEGLDMQKLVAGKKSTIKKLQNINPSAVTQQQIIEHAEDIGVEIIEDEAGAIIILDGKSLDTFVNLLNDDYIQSNLTGERYEIIRKKPIKIKSDDSL